MKQLPQKHVRSHDLFDAANSARSLPAHPVDGPQFRGPVSPYDLTLSRAASTWLHDLPAKLQPAALARQFPRIVNRLARYWDSPRMIAEIFDDLLVGKRLRREGFPANILAELHLLCDYYETLHPEATGDVWNFVLDVERR